MDDAREQFNRFRDSMQPRLSNIQGRLQTVPDRLHGLPQKIDNFPRRRPSPPRSLPGSLPGSRPPTPPRSTLGRPQRAPALTDPAYNHDFAVLASKILYRSGQDPVSGGPLLILCAAAFPDANQVDYNMLLPYVLSNLPGDDELGGIEDNGRVGGYSVVFFAGGGSTGTNDKKGNRPPTWAWTLQAYHLLGRAVRKKIRKLWVVHEKAWVRALFEIMAGVVSVKFRKKVVHLNTLSDLASHLDISKINIPPAIYLHDRKLEQEIVLPGFPPPPTFGRPPFHSAHNPPRVGDYTPLPQVLADTSAYIRQSCLHVEGIFRVPPSQSLLDISRECYDRCSRLRWDEWGPHTAAGLIKLYYRSLPEAMIPNSCYPQMQSLVAVNPDPEKALSEDEEREVRFEVVRSLLTAEVAGLPSFSRILFLRHLLPLLAVIAAHSAENKMTATNLAVCVSPSLARSDDIMADARASAGIRMFIEIGIQRIEELSPKLPLRRGGGGMAQDPDKRHAPSSPTRRKKVPSITLPAVVRKPLPGSGSNSPAEPLTPVTSALLPSGRDVPSPSLPRISNLPPPPPPHDVRTISTTSAQALGALIPPAGDFPPAIRASTLPPPAQENWIPILSARSPTTPLPPAPGKRAHLETAEVPARPRSALLPPSASPVFPVSAPTITPSRPSLRRTASANFPSPSSSSSSSSVAALRNSFNPTTSTQEKTAAPVIRRTRSVIGRGGAEDNTARRGSAVRELSILYEERAKAAMVAARSASTLPAMVPELKGVVRERRRSFVVEKR